MCMDCHNSKSQLDPDLRKNMQARVRGTILDQRPGEYVVVRDDTGTIFAETRQSITPKTGEQVDLWGAPICSPGDVYNMKTRAIEKYGTGSPVPPPAIQTNTSGVKQ